MKLTIYDPAHNPSSAKLQCNLENLDIETHVEGIKYLVDNNDFVICWGYGFRERMRENTLNGHIVGNKYIELQKLNHAGIRCPEVSLVPRPGFIGRRIKHASGNDIRLRRLRRHPDFFVSRIFALREFRVHIFKGRDGYWSIRSGIKLPKNDLAHPWVKTHRAGWTINYGQECQEHITQEVRGLAKRAVEALGYDFGAVDIGVDSRGPCVFEVNSAPGLETDITAEVYATWFKRRLKQHLRRDEEEENERI